MILSLLLFLDITSWQYSLSLSSTLIACFSLALLEVYCQPPPEVEQGYVVAVQKTEYEAGFDIRYLCKKNFQLDGPQKVTCLSKGSWSASPPFCRGKGCLNGLKIR